VKDDSLFVSEGRWTIAGSTIDVAGNPNIAIGALRVVRSGDLWIAEEQLNEVANRYTILPLDDGATATRFNGVNGIMGEVEGSLVFFDDLILVTLRSSDGQYHSCEAMRRTTADRYDTRGALFLSGGHVSSWSYVLERA
jgi:hypothetical protein